MVIKKFERAPTRSVIPISLYDPVPQKIVGGKGRDVEVFDRLDSAGFFSYLNNIQIARMRRNNKAVAVSKSLDFGRNKQKSYFETLFKNNEPVEQFIIDQHKEKEK